MTISSRRRILIAASGSLGSALGLVLVPGQAARAQSDWPSRTIQFMLPVPPGGGVDVTGRRVAEGMSRRLGVAVTSLNQPSAAGLVAAQQLRAAKPDGYTFGYLHSGHIVHQGMSDKLDMRKDFTPIGLFSASQFCIAVANDSPHRTLPDLLDAIRRNPGRLNYGAGGNGSPGHIAWEKLNGAAGGKLEVTQVPFKAAVESVLAVAQGQIDFLSGLFSTALAMQRSGRIRILAVTGPRRSEQLPEVPTVAEAGRLAGYEHVSWGGVFGPAGLPAAIVSRMDQVVRDIAQNADFQAAITRDGSEPRVSKSPEEFRAAVAAEVVATIDLMTRLGLRSV
jgi:tripartite-type tricarboxylate transporter receptor subunit TctC